MNKKDLLAIVASTAIVLPAASQMIEANDGTVVDGLSSSPENPSDVYTMDGAAAYNDESVGIPEDTPNDEISIGAENSPGISVPPEKKADSGDSGKAGSSITTMGSPAEGGFGIPDTPTTPDAPSEPALGDAAVSLDSIESLDPVVDSIQFTEQFFPDAEFRDYLTTNYGFAAGSTLTQEQLDTVTEIHNNGYNPSNPNPTIFKDLTGIEHFKNLETIDCFFNGISKIDVTRNLALTTLNLSFNQLTALDVRQNTNLVELFVAENQISSLDLTNNFGLQYVTISNNPLGDMDFSSLSNLKGLYCAGINLSKLDLSRHLLLEELSCESNKLMDLDVSNNLDLKVLHCDRNQLTNLDLSNNVLLEMLSCDENALTCLDLSKNANLTKFYQYSSQIVEMNISDSSFPDSSLSKDFDASKVSNVTGGQYKEGVFSDFDESTPIEFDYDTGLVLDGNPVLMHVKVDIDAGEQVAVFNDLFFPDPVLREYLSIHYKFNEGDSLSQKKLDKVTAIDFANFESSTGSKLRNLAGIEYFRNLISLDCRVNDLSFLPDLSKNPLLEYLNCSANPITSIDVSQNVLLRNLCCATCQIQELDLSKLENLEYLLCSYNSIKKLDLSNNPLLKTLFCLSNQLTSLDLSSNVLLETLACSGNQITNLDLSKNKNLKEFMNYGPQNLYCIAKEGKIEGTSLSEAFDISKVLNVTGGQYKEGIFSDFDESTPIEFDYDTGLVLEGSPVLMHVKVNVEAGDVVIVFNEQFIPDPVLRQYLSEQYGFIEGRGLTQEQLDQVKEIVYNRYENNQRPALTDLTGVEYFRNLTNLNVFNNELIALDVSKNTNLETLFCANNALTSLDVSKNLKLVDLDFSYNKIKNINVTQNTELVDFHTNNNQLENIDVSKNIHLIRLSFMNNLVKVLDISNNPEIESLLCTDNQLTHLDLSMNSKLSVLDCARNKLTMLDFSNNPDLEILCVEGNLLSKIDISSLGNLVEFICGYNQLTDLDISQNQKLKLFLCEKNILQALDVSKNPGLDILDCSENQLKELDLSNNMEMTYLKCIGNQLAGLDLSHTKISSIESSLVGNQTVSVPVSSNQLDFKSLFGFLDFSKILNVTGAEYANGIFTNFNFVEPVEYDYDTGLVFDGRSFVMHTTLNLKKIISVVFDEQYFPDPLFREYLAKTFGFVEGSKLSQEQLDRVTEISCSGLDSMDLNKPRMDSVTGIEHFRNLKKLDVSSNNLGKIDISNNTQLTELRVDYTKLSALDITNNPGLEVLWYAGNPIGNLDVSHLSQLRSLSCGSTNRSQLDVSSNPLLEQLFCGSNDLTELDLSNNGLLKELNASHNALRFLILPKTSKLEQLDCSFNQLEEIMLPERSNLIKLNVLNNGLKALNLANVSGLISLNCGGNQIVSLTISNLLGLEKLYCSSNPLGTLDVSANTALSDLGCANCQLKGLDVSQNKELTSLFCSSNELASLDLKNNPLLVELICDSNQLTKLDLSANSRLQHLGCADNVLTKLDVTSNPQLKWMYCANNALKTLDLSKNPLLNLVSCAGNQITYLDLSQNTNLKAFVIEEGEDPQTTMISVSSNVLKSGALAETLNAEKVLNVKGADYKNGMFSNFTLDTPIEYDYDTGINLNGEPVLLHVILSLEKEPVYLEWDEKLDFVYNEDQIVAPKLDVEGISDEKVSYTWEEKTENGWVKLDKAPTDAGSYRISAVVESENSEESPVVSKPIEFDIAKAENEGKLEMKESWTYGEEPPLPEIETKFESEVTYEVQKVSKARRMRRMSKLATQSLDFQMPTEAGEYMLVANVAGTKNVEALSLVAYFTILPKPAEDLKEPDESEIKDLEDFVLKNGDEPLIEGVDYEKETIQVGNQVTVRVNFKNNYSGTKEYTYTIHSTPDTPKPDQPKPDNPKPSQPGQDDSKPNPSGPNHSMPEHPEQNRPKPNQKEESSKSDLDSNQELVHLDVSQTSARQVIRVESISPNTSVETGTSAYWFGTITSVLGGLFSWKKRKKK